MVATIILIFLVWGVAGYSFYRSKIGNSILSKYTFSPVENSDYTVEEREEFFTHTNVANETANANQNNYVLNEKKAQIYFNHDSNDLHSQSLKVLIKLSKLTLQHPDSKVIIEGYTDSNGNYWYNKKLSKIRAGIVKSYLVEKGISPF